MSDRHERMLAGHETEHDLVEPWAMPYLWSDETWRDYQLWQSQDKKTLRGIDTLFKDIGRTGGDGIGKTELLRGGLGGLRSARIDEKNRPVFAVDGDVVRVVSSRGHHRDR